MRAKEFTGLADISGVQERGDGWRCWIWLAVVLMLPGLRGGTALAQSHAQAQAQAGAQAQAQAGAQAASGVAATRVAARGQARRFLGGRTLATGEGGAASLAKARAEHAAMVLARPRLSALNSTWTAVGPMRVTSPAYGAITGRVSSVAIDPGDGTGNTVYVGTTGGGVWKSTNAAGLRRV